MTVWAFYKSYIIRVIPVNMDGYIHFHAVISSLWIGLLISQPILIRQKKIKAHKILGRVSYVVFPLLIASFIPIIIRKWAGLASVINPVFDVVLLLLFYALALIHKKNTPVHMRYMIAITLIFIGPTLARILFHWTDISGFWGTMFTWGSINVCLLCLLIWDKINNRQYQPYIVSFSAFFIYLIVLFFITY